MEAYLEESQKSRKTGDSRWVSAVFTLIFGAMTAAYAYLPQFRFSDILITGMRNVNKDEIIYFSYIHLGIGDWVLGHQR